jgi:soluble lytic murein transglycosylase-like protein
VAQVPAWLWFLGAAGVATVAAFGRDTPEILASVVTGGHKGTADPELVRVLAEKWGPIHACPVYLIRVIARIESGNKPQSLAMYGGVITAGGAWGLMQQALATAKGNVVALKKSSNPDVQAAIARFDGTGTSLYDPDLNVCLGAYQLGHLWGEFGNFLEVAGAYHQGAGKIRAMKAKGLAINAATLLASGAPNGSAYVTRALAAKDVIG